jgi:hypothetical protein
MEKEKEQMIVFLNEMMHTINFDLNYATNIKSEADRQDIIHHMDEIKRFADLVISHAQSIELKN